MAGMTSLVCRLLEPFSRLSLSRVFDARVVRAVKTVEERFFKLGKFLYRQIALVELPIHELVKNRLVDHGYKRFG